MTVPSSASDAGQSTISFEEALAAFECGAGEAAVERIGATLRAGSADARLWHLHGLILRHMEKREEAIPSLQKAAELAPNSERIAHALARTLLEAGLPSVEAYVRALRLAPADTEMLSGMTSALAAEGRAGEAISALERLLSHSPHWTGGHILLAQLRWAEGERDGFARSFEAASGRVPQNLDLWREWLIVLLHAEQFDEASRVIAAGRSKVGDNAVFAVNEAIVAAETEKCELAEGLFQPFEGIDDATVQLRRIRHYLRWNRPEKADEIITAWSHRPEAFLFWPYASIAWRMLGDSRWQWLEGDDSFVGVYDIADRLPSLDLVADTLRSLHTRTGQPLEQSLRGGSQTEGHLFMHVDPVLVQMREAIRAVVAEHVANFPPHVDRHPLLGKPRSPIGFSGAWSVWLKTGGFHANHVHPAGWISSALYIVLPSDLGSSGAGWLALGDPTSPTLNLDMAPFRTIQPKPGRLALFPSYTWHGTKPFDEGERITLAFDVAVPQGRP